MPIGMEKFVISFCLLSVCLLIGDSSCFSSLFKHRQSIQKKSGGFFKQPGSFSHGNGQARRRNPPPPPPPPPEDQGIWNVAGTTREEFVAEHRDSLTSSVREAISDEMEQAVSSMKGGMAYIARSIACMILSQTGPVEKRTVVDALTDIERNITVEETQEEKDLQDLLDSLDLNITTLKQAAEERPLPRFLEDCQSSPLIMRTGNGELDSTQELATCSWVLFSRVEEELEELDENTLESFVDKFEAFLRGIFTFFQLYDPWLEGIQESQQSAEFDRMLSTKELQELKRILENTIYKTYKK